MVKFTKEIPNGKLHLIVQRFFQSIFYVLIKWEILLLMFVISLKRIAAEITALLLVTRTVLGTPILTEGFLACILSVSWCKYLFASVCKVLI